MFPAAARPLSLRPFTPIEGGAVRALGVQVAHEPGTLHLRYTLDGDLARLRIPTVQPSRQADELWRHTCFEAFLRDRDGSGYHELNVAPSTEWALYAFDDYRHGMRSLHAPVPWIQVARVEHQLTVEVRLDLQALPPSRALALTAVIEDQSGSLTYWALKHPSAKPDFHHADGFALEL